MTAYIVVRMKVTDPEQYKRYTARTPDCVASFGGRFIVRGGETVTLEGPEFSDRMVVIEFPSLERARNSTTRPNTRRSRRSAPMRRWASSSRSKARTDAGRGDSRPAAKGGIR